RRRAGGRRAPGARRGGDAAGAADRSRQARRDDRARDGRRTASAATQRRAALAPAPARRSPSLRARLPPRTAQSRADLECARRDSRRRSGAARGAAQGVRLRRRAQGRRGGRDRRARASSGGALEPRGRRAARSRRRRRVGRSAEMSARVLASRSGAPETARRRPRPLAQRLGDSPLVPAIDGWLEDLRKGGRLSSNTLEAYRRDAFDYALFAGAHGVRRWGEVTRTVLDAYLAQLFRGGRARSTLMRRRSALARLHRHLLRHGELPADFLLDLPPTRP